MNIPPSDTQTSQRTAPTNSPAELDGRLNSIEDDLKKYHTYRHERNQAYSAILDEIRVHLYENDEELKELRSMHKELIDVLIGVMGRQGVIAEITEHDTRLVKLENWQRDMKGFITGVLAICSLVSALLTAGMSYLMHILKG